MNGFHSDAGALKKVSRELRSGVSSLDTLAGNMPDAVDAGFSSQAVGSALARVIQGCTALAQIGEDIAANVDTADGSYADIENTNAGAIRYQERRHEPGPDQRQQSQSTPFEESPLHIPRTPR
ncbi:hypothetical protein [Amycolatopsis sp. NPDC049868]|uniref:hypothetical protein n=1 Tax=Amycolatopsis sp. NPDC049868 TaxID=3363934 RepID=UPI0037A54757